MSTATVFPEPETAAPETPPEPDPAPESAPRGASAPESAPWQEAVLGLLAQGASVTDAMRHVGYSSAAFYKTGTCHRSYSISIATTRRFFAHCRLPPAHVPSLFSLTLKTQKYYGLGESMECKSPAS